MNPALKAYYVFRHVGPRLLWLRAGVYWRRSLGITRRMFQPRPWEQIKLSEIVQPGTPTNAEEYAAFKRAQAPAFFFTLGRPPQVPDSISKASLERQPSFGERLRLLEQMRCIYFAHFPSPEPIDWYHNPLDDKRSNPTRIWCDIPDFSPEQGDMRLMWEPSRAGWAIDLARARAWGFDVDAGTLFWKWVDSWMQACPPYTGFQWKCGQESSIRLLGIALGFWALADDPATTPRRWEQFARLAWATGYRVAHHISYAISQKNNHALSEAFGLMLVGYLFPEFRESPEWWATGRSVLASEIRRQIADDGTYLQNSMNYHRVMLHICLAGMRLAELAGEPLDRDIYERFGRAGEFLYQMMETRTGRLPEYGPNEGAYVLPLSECDITDFRPVIQAAHFLASRKRLFPSGPWDEDLLWLFGPEALAAEQSPPREPVSSAFRQGGYYTLRRTESWVMTRCHTYRGRPAECDQLHLDLWWRGQNILRDCGTYHYYTPDNPALEHYFKSVASHNTIEIDGADPLELVSRFLWLPWPRATMRHFVSTGPALWFEGEHYDYDRAPWRVLHRRTVIGLDGDVWVVVDDLIGSGRHRAVLRWHMMDVPCEFDSAAASLKLATKDGDVFLSVFSHPQSPQTFDIVRGRNEPGRIQGFASPYYAELLPIPTLEIGLAGTLPQRLLTVVAPGVPAAARLLRETSDSHDWEIDAGANAWQVALAPPNRSSRQTLRRCSALTASRI